MTTAPNPDEIVRRLQGKGVTQGWDVIHALSAHKVNELFQRQFVVNLQDSDHLPPITGVVPVIGNYRVEFADLVLGQPMLAFDPDAAPQAAMLTIPIISGVANTTVTAAGATNVVSTQWITQAYGYTITGTVPLEKVTGDVEHQTHIGLRFDNAKGFFADLGVSGAAGTVLGTYFRDLLSDPRKGLRGYSLGTLDYTPNATDLTPAGDFEIATQRDPDDPGDAGRVLLLIPTTYNPKGGGHAPLPLNNVVPAGMDTTLLVSSEVVMGRIVGGLVSAVFGADAVEASDDGTGVWQVKLVGGTVWIPIQVKSDLGSVQSGHCKNAEPVMVRLKGIGFAPKDGWLTAAWQHQWPQPWSVQATTVLGTICDEGDVTMAIALDVSYRPGVDPVTAIISFTAATGLGVTFENADGGGNLFHDVLFEQAEARQAVCDWIAKEVAATFGNLFDFTIPQIGAFAVTNLLFPGRQTSRLLDVRVPGDLVAFGTLKAPDFAVTPPVATMTTAETLTFAVPGQTVAWSVPRGAGTIDEAGVYRPPAKVARSKVVVVTATAQGQQAYAAVVVTPAQVQVAPAISVFEPRGVAQTFTAVLPGATEKPVWSISPSVGKVDDTGAYTPPDKVEEPVAVTLTARLGKETGTAQLVVFPTLPVAMQVTPYAPAPLGPGATQGFTAAFAGKPVTPEWSLFPQTGEIDKEGLYTAPDTVTAPQAVLVVARDPGQPALGGTAVVLLSPDDNDTRAIMRPEPDGPRTGRTGDVS